MRIIEASAKLQLNVAMILEAKAVEAEKVRNWLCNHVTSDAFDVQEEQLEKSLQIHKQVVDVIEGLTQLGQGMVSVLKIILRHDSEGSEMGGFGDMDSGGDRS
jgi:hypothetical protein